MYGNAMRYMRGPSPGFGPGGMTGMPNLGGGFNPPSVVPMHGGMGKPMGGGGGGWGGAIRGALGFLGSQEGAYIASSALGGISDWWNQREDRKLTERLENNRREDERRHREAMGRSLNSAWGG